MRVSVAAAVVLSAHCLSCGMCEPTRKEAPPERAATSAPSGPIVVGTIASNPRIPPSAWTTARRTNLSCRAIAVEGDVAAAGDAGAPLSAQAEVRSEDWLVLGKGARLVVKDPRTARETTFRGPGRARACVDALEESWLEQGGFESSVGAGENPGAEEWVVTPLGVVRFTAAQLGVQTLSGTVQVRLAEGGVAYLWPAADASGVKRASAGGNDPDEGWSRLAAGTVLLAPAAAREPFDAAQASVATCSTLGQSARDLASALLRTPDPNAAGEAGARDGGSASAIASRQVVTRRLARAACAVASLRVAALAPSDARSSLAAKVRDASSNWRALPVAY